MKRVVVLMLFALAGCEDATLSACDEAVKAQLKAPSTYKRLSADGFASDAKTAMWTITYDANNAFNVPLRGKGQCLISKGQTSWFEEQH